MPIYAVSFLWRQISRFRRAPAAKRSNRKLVKIGRSNKLVHETTADKIRLCEAFSLNWLPQPQP
jgi:hypothetical protein